MSALWRVQGHRAAYKTMIRPAVSTQCNSSPMYITSIALASDDVIQHVPVLGARMHPSCLVFIGLLEKHVGNDKFVLGAGLQKKCAIRILVSNGVMPQDSSPCGVITSHSSVKIFEDEKSIPVGHGRYSRAQFRVKQLLFLVRGSHGRCIGTNEDSQAAIAELQLESHQDGADTLWLICQLRYQRVPNCKTNPMLSRLALRMSRRVEGLAHTKFHELAHT